MYATVSDMIARFGETQMIRLSRPEDRSAETVDDARIETALSDASALIDGYLRARYTVPVAAPPLEIKRAACILARYDLAQGEHVDPSKEMDKGRADVVAWLETIAKELVNLDIPAAPISGAAVGSGPAMIDRERVMTHENLRFL